MPTMPTVTSSTISQFATPPDFPRGRPADVLAVGVAQRPDLVERLQPVGHVDRALQVVRLERRNLGVERQLLLTREYLGVHAELPRPQHQDRLDSRIAELFAQLPRERIDLVNVGRDDGELGAEALGAEVTCGLLQPRPIGIRSLDARVEHHVRRARSCAAVTAPWAADVNPAAMSTRVKTKIRRRIR